MSSPIIIWSSKLSPLIWIGINQPWRMPCGWDYQKSWMIPSHIVICQRTFLHLLRCVRSGRTRFENARHRQRACGQEQGQVVPLPPDLQQSQMAPQSPWPDQLPDIQDLHLWIPVWANRGSLQKKGQRGLRMGDDCTVLGSTTGRPNAGQEKRPRHWRQLVWRSMK